MPKKKRNKPNVITTLVTIPTTITSTESAATLTSTTTTKDIGAEESTANQLTFQQPAINWSILEITILNDDLEKFNELKQSHNEKPLHNDFTPIELAVMFGSVNIFTHLLNENPEAELEVSNLSLLHWAALILFSSYFTKNYGSDSYIESKHLKHQTIFNALMKRYRDSEFTCFSTIASGPHQGLSVLFILCYTHNWAEASELIEYLQKTAQLTSAVIKFPLKTSSDDISSLALPSLRRDLQEKLNLLRGRDIFEIFISNGQYALLENLINTTDLFNPYESLKEATENGLSYVGKLAEQHKTDIIQLIIDRGLLKKDENFPADAFAILSKNENNKKLCLKILSDYQVQFYDTNITWYQLFINKNFNQKVTVAGTNKKEKYPIEYMIDNLSVVGLQLIEKLAEQLQHSEDRLPVAFQVVQTGNEALIRAYHQNFPLNKVPAVTEKPYCSLQIAWLLADLGLFTLFVEIFVIPDAAFDPNLNPEQNHRGETIVNDFWILITESLDEEKIWHLFKLYSVPDINSLREHSIRTADELLSHKKNILWLLTVNNKHKVIEKLLKNKDKFKIEFDLNYPATTDESVEVFTIADQLALFNIDLLIKFIEADVLKLVTMMPLKRAFILKQLAKQKKLDEIFFLKEFLPEYLLHAMVYGNLAEIIELTSKGVKLTKAFSEKKRTILQDLREDAEQRQTNSKFLVLVQSFKQSYLSFSKTKTNLPNNKFLAKDEYGRYLLYYLLIYGCFDIVMEVFDSNKLVLVDQMVACLIGELEDSVRIYFTESIIKRVNIFWDHILDEIIEDSNKYLMPKFEYLTTTEEDLTRRIILFIKEFFTTFDYQDSRLRTDGVNTAELIKKLLKNKLNKLKSCQKFKILFGNFLMGIIIKSLDLYSKRDNLTSQQMIFLKTLLISIVKYADNNNDSEDAKEGNVLLIKLQAKNVCNTLDFENILENLIENINTQQNKIKKQIFYYDYLTIISYFKLSRDLLEVQHNIWDFLFDKAKIFICNPDKSVRNTAIVELKVKLLDSLIKNYRCYLSFLYVCFEDLVNSSNVHEILEDLENLQRKLSGIKGFLNNRSEFLQNDYNEILKSLDNLLVLFTKIKANKNKSLSHSKAKTTSTESTINFPVLVAPTSLICLATVSSNQEIIIPSDTELASRMAHTIDHNPAINTKSTSVENNIDITQPLVKRMDTDSKSLTKEQQKNKLSAKKERRRLAREAGRKVKEALIASSEEDTSALETSSSSVDSDEPLANPISQAIKPDEQSVNTAGKQPQPILGEYLASSAYKPDFFNQQHNVVSSASVSLFKKTPEQHLCLKDHQRVTVPKPA